MTYNMNIVWILVLHAELMEFAYCFTRAMYRYTIYSQQS